MRIRAEKRRRKTVKEEEKEPEEAKIKTVELSSKVGGRRREGGRVLEQRGDSKQSTHTAFQPLCAWSSRLSFGKTSASTTVQGPLSAPPSLFPLRHPLLSLPFHSPQRSQTAEINLDIHWAAKIDHKLIKVWRVMRTPYDSRL